jgi:hypothetical protein
MTTTKRVRIPFGDAETITVAELQVGDFVVQFPRQDNIRALQIDALVERIDELSDDELSDDELSAWTQRPAPGVKRRRAPARRVVTRLGNINVPSACTLVVRRPIVVS